MGGPWGPYSCFVGGLLLAAAWPCRGADACPSSSWISFGSSCYALLHASIDSIDDARELCKGNASGADIVSINNKEENTFILKTFHTHWKGPKYISLGMFFDTDDNVFKWYDESKVNFTNWMEEESSNELLNTCATMNTTSGRWKKTSCEHLPLTQILCEDIPAYEKKYLPDKPWITFLVVFSTIIVSVSAALLWFLYQRKTSTTFMAHLFSSQAPCNDEVILIGEENEYTA